VKPKSVQRHLAIGSSGRDHAFAEQGKQRVGRERTADGSRQTRQRTESISLTLSPKVSERIAVLYMAEEAD